MKKLIKKHGAKIICSLLVIMVASISPMSGRAATTIVSKEGTANFTSSGTSAQGSVRLSANSTMTLTMQKYNTQLLQGTVTFIPLSGTSKSFDFSNLSFKVYTIDLPSLPSGTYQIRIQGSLLGAASVSLSYVIEAPSPY